MDRANPSPPPLTWLRAFEAAARHLSFTRAGEELGLTQSAVSQHVRALEGHLGKPLFHRAHRQLHLSDAGRLLLPDVTAGLALLGQAAQRFRHDDQHVRLRIAASASILRHILAPRLAAFRSQAGPMSIDLQSTIWPDDFMATSADVEIRFGRPEMVGAGAERMRPCALHAVATPDLARRVAADLAARAVPDAALIQAIGISAHWSDLIPGAKPDYVVDTHGMAVDLALEEAGIALAHVQITRPALQAGTLVSLGLPDIPAQEGYFLAADPSPQAQAFADWFRSITLAA